MRYGSGCTWIDYDRDGNLDLFVAHYMVFDRQDDAASRKGPPCNYRGVAVYCGPEGSPQEPCRLYHNNGDGTFTDVSEKAGISTVKPGYCLTVVAADFDGDGWPDIYVACDTSPSLLFRNNHDGTFTEQGLESGVSLSEDGQEQAGMGLGSATSIPTATWTFSKPISATTRRRFTAATERPIFGMSRSRSGLGVETRFVSWGAGIFDLDNDGLPDLFYATGMVYPEVEKSQSRLPLQNPLRGVSKPGQTGNSRSCWKRRGREFGNCTPAALWLSATSTTTATSTS